MLTYDFNVSTSKRCRKIAFLAWANLCETPHDHSLGMVVWSISSIDAFTWTTFAGCLSNSALYTIQYKIAFPSVHRWSPTTPSDSAVDRCFACLCDEHAVRHTSERVMAPNVWNSLLNDIISLLTFCVKPKTHFYCCVLVINIVICTSLYWLLVDIMFATWGWIVVFCNFRTLYIELWCERGRFIAPSVVWRAMNERCNLEVSELLYHQPDSRWSTDVM